MAVQTRRGNRTVSPVSLLSVVVVAPSSGSALGEFTNGTTAAFKGTTRVLVVVGEGEAALGVLVLVPLSSIGAVAVGARGVGRRVLGDCGESVGDAVKGIAVGAGAPHDSSIQQSTSVRQAVVLRIPIARRLWCWCSLMVCLVVLASIEVRRKKESLVR
jgi:hypothetical protein